MRKISLYLLLGIVLLGFVLAKEAPFNNEFSKENHTSVKDIHSTIPVVQEQRSSRQEEKKMIKEQLLILYQQVKKEKDGKKEIKQEISTLRKEIRRINAKIAQSYKQYIKDSKK